jgi:hypothetical protein
LLIITYNGVEKGFMKEEKNSPVIVCPECGNIFEVDKDSRDTPCPHQKKFLDEIKSDPRFKEW